MSGSTIAWYDIQHVRDAVLRLSFRVKDNGTARDLTGYGAEFSLYARQGDATPVATKTVGSGIVLTPASGLLALTVSAADFDDVPPPGGFYQLVLIEPDAERVPLLQGACLLAP